MAVDFQHPLGAGLLVEAIDVLGDDGVDLAHAFHLGQGQMCGIGAGMEDIFGQGFEPVVEALGVLAKGPQAGHLQGIGETPQPGHVRTKVGDA